MTKDEALKACLDYVDGDWEMENIDLSDETFSQAMQEAGLIYKDRKGEFKKRARNGIFSHNKDGVPHKGMSQYEVEAFIGLGFAVDINVDGKTFHLQKMEGDPSVVVSDDQIVGFCSPTRDTRAHWLQIPGDVRPAMLSFTTQMPPDKDGKTSLLENVWEKGTSKKDPSKTDFYHNDVSQRQLGSFVVKTCQSHLAKATKPQWIELTFEKLRDWNTSMFTASEKINDHEVQLEKKAHEKFAVLKIDGERVGVLTDQVTRLYRHFTYVKLDENENGERHEKIKALSPADEKAIMEWAYAYMVDASLRQKCLKKSNKKLGNGTKTLTSLEQLESVKA